MYKKMREKKYSPLKAFHFPERLKLLPQDSSGICVPPHVRVKPTNRCNHHCSYCAYLAPELQLGQDMDTRDYIPREKMLEIVEDFASMGVHAVTFSGGGEPFCYPYLNETVHCLATYGIKFASLTNGALLKGEVAKSFAENASWLRVSVDGWDDASYAKYRNINEGAFTALLENMRAFSAMSKGCALGMNIVIDKNNAPHLFDMVNLFRECGANNVKLGACIVSNDANINNAYHKEIWDVVNGQIEKIKELESDDFEVFNSYHLLSDKFEKSYHWCPYLQLLPVIGADQNVYSCHDKAYNLESGVIGSIKTQSFRDLWMSDKNLFYKIDPSRDCNHHCVCNDRNMLILDWLSEDHVEFV